MEKDTCKVGHSGRYPWGSGEKNKKQGLSIYRHKDGTLTKLGKRKAERAAKSYAKATGKKLVLNKVQKKKEQKNEETNKKRTYKDLSYKELTDLNNLIKARQEFLKLTGQEPKVNRFKYLKNEAFWPAIKQAGKDSLQGFFTKTFKNALGLNNNNNKNNNNNNNNKNDNNNKNNKNNSKKIDIPKDINVDNLTTTIKRGGKLIKKATSAKTSQDIADKIAYKGEKIINNTLKKYSGVSYKSLSNKTREYRDSTLVDLLAEYKVNNISDIAKRKISRARTL